MVVKRSAVPTVVLVAAAALVALLVYGVLQSGDGTKTLDDQVKQGKRPTAPGLQRALPRLEGGGDTRLAGYRGKVVVVNFFASWCEPCIAEAPLLEKAQKQLSAAGSGTVVAVSYNDLPGDARSFAREHGFSFPILRDMGTKLAKGFGTTKLPETFVLDRQGRVTAIARGQLKDGFLERAIARAETA